jgi:hypothetical protein
MLTVLVTWLVLLVLIIVISYAFWRQSKLHQLGQWSAQENMPWELRRAALFASEQPLQCETPVPLSGIPDQIYRTLFGRLILVDSKTRSRAVVYEADIVQLSVYRMIIENTSQAPFAGRRVKTHAYIRLSTPEEVCYQRVSLLDNTVIIDHYQRYQELINEEREPDFADNPALCWQCSHRRVCPAMLDILVANTAVNASADDESDIDTAV